MAESNFRHTHELFAGLRDEIDRIELVLEERMSAANGGGTESSSNVFNLEQRRVAEQTGVNGHIGEAWDNTAWLKDCICSDTGKPLPVLANALIGLRAVFSDAVAFDEMARVTTPMRPVEATATTFAPRPITVIDFDEIVRGEFAEIMRALESAIVCGTEPAERHELAPDRSRIDVHG